MHHGDDAGQQMDLLSLLEAKDVTPNDAEGSAWLNHTSTRYRPLELGTTQEIHLELSGQDTCRRAANVRAA